MVLGFGLVVGFLEEEVVHDGKSSESNPFHGPCSGEGLQEFCFLCKESSALWAIGNEKKIFPPVHHDLVDFVNHHNEFFAL